MPKQRIILIVGLVLALLAIFMTKVYLDEQKRLIQERANKKLADMQANQTAVLVAKKDIPRGTILEGAMLDTSIVPNKYVQPQAVTSLDRIAGMQTVTAISKGEQISLNKLSYNKQAGGLAQATPIGKRAITISVDNISALVGMLNAGDYVDVIAMIPVPTQTQEGKQVVQLLTLPLFQNVLVLAVGQDTSVVPKDIFGERYKKEEEKTSTAPLITLALGPQEANLIAFVQEQGKIRLTLRSPADSKIEEVQPANWDTLLQYVMPKSEGLEKKEEPVPIGYVEVYRGLNKEKVPIYK